VKKETNFQEKDHLKNRIEDLKIMIEMAILGNLETSASRMMKMKVSKKTEALKEETISRNSVKGKEGQEDLKMRINSKGNSNQGDSMMINLAKGAEALEDLMMKVIKNLKIKEKDHLIKEKDLLIKTKDLSKEEINFKNMINSIIIMTTKVLEV